MTESRSLIAGGQVWEWDRVRLGRREVWSNENVLYHNYGGGYMTIHVRQNINFTVETGEFYCM